MEQAVTRSQTRTFQRTTESKLPTFRRWLDPIESGIRGKPCSRLIERMNSSELDAVLYSPALWTAA